MTRISGSGESRDRGRSGDLGEIGDRDMRHAASPLPPPPPALKIVEDNFVAAAHRHDLPVPAAQGAPGPPAVLDQPRFAHAVHFTVIDDQWLAIMGGGHGHAARDREAA